MKFELDRKVGTISFGKEDESCKKAQVSQFHINFTRLHRNKLEMVVVQDKKC